MFISTSLIQVVHGRGPVNLWQFCVKVWNISGCCVSCDPASWGWDTLSGLLVTGSISIGPRKQRSSLFPLFMKPHQLHRLKPSTAKQFVTLLSQHPEKPKCFKYPSSTDPVSCPLKPLMFANDGLVTVLWNLVSWLCGNRQARLCSMAHHGIGTLALLVRWSWAANARPMELHGPMAEFLDATCC